MNENPPKAVTPTSSGQTQTILGRSAVVKGELSASEDLVLEGQFEGSINVPENCLTVGAQGQAKSEIQARLVVVHGTVNGKISAKERVEIRKTGSVVGDVVSAGVAIEDGAYFKGSIEIVREGNTGAASQPSRKSAAASSA